MGLNMYKTAKQRTAGAKKLKAEGFKTMNMGKSATGLYMLNFRKRRLGDKK